MSVLAAEQSSGLQVVTGSASVVPETWRHRKAAARRDRQQYERQWQVNQHFAAQNQHLLWSPRDGRVLANTALKDRDGRPLRTADVLGQYVQTAIGKLGGDDLRPQLLLLHEDDLSQEYGEFVNEAFGWGWENEWQADDRLRRLLRILAVLGTGAVRCRYDRSQGATLSREVPHGPDGRPILDEQAQRDYVLAQQAKGMSANLRPLREGRVCWDVLDAWNLLPPPGIEDPAEFPWEIIVRAVHIDQVRDMYGSAARRLTPEPVTAMGLLGNTDDGLTFTNDGYDSPSTGGGRLEEHVLLYTGYQRPTSKTPDGQTIVWAGDLRLDEQSRLPYTDDHGCRSGTTYFRWTVVPKRFFGIAFIEPGIDPQRVRNKRLAQIDETIDRGQPKIFAEEGLNVRSSGIPLEIIEVPRGAQLPQTDGGIPPGPWMSQDVEQQDGNVQKALGLSDVQLGQAPAGVSAYSAMAMLSENDAQKLNPVAQDFRAGIAKVSVDSVEAMRNWGQQKRILLAGDDGRVGAAVFDATRIPSSYLVKPAKGSVLPRSQAAQIQKLADLWDAALVAGAVTQAPSDWLTWYQESQDAGKPQPLPKSTGFEQRHKAALENVVMAHTGQPVPVAEYDDPTLHVELHRQQQMQLAEAQDAGNPTVAQAIQAVEQHVQQHLQMAERNAQVAAANQTPASPAAAAAGGPPSLPQLAQQLRYQNRPAVAAPLPPNVRV